MGLDFLTEYKNQMTPDTGISDSEAEAIKGNVDASLAQEQQDNQKAALQGMKDQVAQQKAAAAQQAQSIKEKGGIVVHDANGLPTEASAPAPAGGTEPVAKTAHSNYVIGRNTGRVLTMDPQSQQYVEPPSDHYINPSTGAQFKSYGNGVFKQPVLDETGQQVTDPVWTNKKAYGSAIDKFVNDQSSSVPDIVQKNNAVRTATLAQKQAQSDYDAQYGKNGKATVELAKHSNDDDYQDQVKNFQAQADAAFQKAQPFADAVASAKQDVEAARDKAAQVAQNLKLATQHKRILADTGTLPPDVAQKYWQALSPQTGTGGLPSGAAPTPPAPDAQPVSQAAPGDVPATPEQQGPPVPVEQQGPPIPKIATPEETADLPIAEHAAALKQSDEALQIQAATIQQHQQQATAPLQPIQAKQQDWENRSQMLLYGRLLAPGEDPATVPMLPTAQTDSLQTMDDKTITFPKGMKQELRDNYSEQQKVTAQIQPQLQAVQGEQQAFQENLDNHNASKVSLNAKIAAEKQTQEEQRQAGLAKIRETAPEVADKLEGLHSETQQQVAAINANGDWTPAAKEAAITALQGEAQKKEGDIKNPVTRITKEQEVADDYRALQESIDNRNANASLGEVPMGGAEQTSAIKDLAAKHGVSPEDLEKITAIVRARPYSLDDGHVNFAPYGTEGLPDPDQALAGVSQAEKDGVIAPIDPAKKKELESLKGEYDEAVKTAGGRTQMQAALRGLGRGGAALLASVPGAKIGALAGNFVPGAGETGISQAIGAAIGGLAGAAGGAWTYDKVAQWLGKYSDVINSANAAAKVSPEAQGVGELASFALAPTRILSKAAWAEGAGEALKPALVRSIQNYGRLADVAAESAGTDAAAREAAASNALLRAGVGAVGGAAIFTGLQSAMDLKIPTARDIATNVGLALLLHGNSLEFKSHSAEDLQSVITRGTVRQNAGISPNSVGADAALEQAFKDAGVDLSNASPELRAKMMKPLTSEERALYKNASDKIEQLRNNGATGAAFEGGQTASIPGVFGKKFPVASAAVVEGKGKAEGGGGPGLGGGAAPTPTQPGLSTPVTQAASDGEIEGLEPDQALRAQALRDIAQGKPIAELQQHELNAIGLDRTVGSDKLTPFKPVGDDGKPGQPVTPDVHVDAVGNAIILQPAINDLAKVAPATAGLIRPESEALKQFAPKTTEELRGLTPKEEVAASPAPEPATPTKTREQAVKESTAKLHADLADAKEIQALGGENEKTGKDLISKAQREHKARVIEALKLPKGPPSPPLPALPAPKAKPFPGSPDTKGTDVIEAKTPITKAVPVPTPAAAPSPLDEAAAAHGKGRVAVLTKALDEFKPLFQGVKVGPTQGAAGIEYDPDSGALHVDPVKFLGHVDKTGGGTVAGIRKEITKALFEEKEHRLSTLLDNRPDGKPTATTDPQFAKDLDDMWASVPDSTKKEQAESYWKEEGAKFASDWHAKHEWWADVAAKLGRGEVPASLEDPSLSEKLKKVISSYLKALVDWLAKAPAEVKAAYARTVAKLKALEAKLAKGDPLDKMDQGKREELRKVYGGDHPSFPDIARRAEGRAEREKGPFGKFGQMARKEFSESPHPLVAHPDLRKALNLPAMPSSINIDKDTRWKEAAQHTMDALAEKAEMPRSSMAHEDMHKAVLTAISKLAGNEGGLHNSTVETLLATGEIHRKIGHLFADEGVRTALDNAQAEAAAGQLTPRTEAILKGQLVKKAKDLNIEQGPRTPSGKDWTEISTRYAIPKFLDDIRAGRVLRGATPKDWLARQYIQREAEAGKELPEPSPARNAQPNGGNKSGAPEDAGLKMGFDPFAEDYVIPGTEEVNQAKRAEIIANKKLDKGAVIDNKGEMQTIAPPPPVPQTIVPPPPVPKTEETSDQMLQPKKGISRSHLMHLEALQRAEDAKAKLPEIQDPRARLAEGAQALRDKKDAMERIARLPKAVEDLKNRTFDDAEKLHRNGDITSKLFNQYVDMWNAGPHMTEQPHTLQTDDEHEFPRVEETPSSVVAQVKQAVSEQNEPINQPIPVPSAKGQPTAKVAEGSKGEDEAGKTLEPKEGEGKALTKKEQNQAAREAKLKKPPVAGSPEAKEMFDKSNKEAAQLRQAHILAQGFVKKGDEWVHPNYLSEGIYSDEVPPPKAEDVRRELAKLKGETPKEPPSDIEQKADKILAKPKFHESPLGNKVRELYEKPKLSTEDKKWIRENFGINKDFRQALARFIVRTHVDPTPMTGIDDDKSPYPSAITAGNKATGTTALATRINDDDAGTAFYVNSIQSLVPGSGGGKATLDALKAKAAAHGLPILLDPQAFGDMPQTDLVKWYSKQGFEPMAGRETMIWRPEAKDFPSQVLDAAKEVPKEGRFGEIVPKVFIAHLWDAYSKKFKGVPSIEAFKQKLLEANQKGTLGLSRADLTEAFKPDDLKKSLTLHPVGEEFHFLRTETPEEEAISRKIRAQESSEPLEPSLSFIYADQIKGSSTSMADVLDTWKAYQKANPGATRGEFVAKMGAAAKAGQITMEGRESPQDLTAEERDTLIPQAKGPPGAYWKPTRLGAAPAVAEPKIGRHGGWIDAKGTIHPVEATYGHADVAEEKTGVEIKTPDDYNKVYEKGMARLVNSSDGIFVTYGDKKLNRSQVKTLQDLEVYKNKKVYIDRGGKGFENLNGTRLGTAPGAASVPQPGRGPDPIEAAIKELQLPSRPALRAVVKNYLKTGNGAAFIKNVVAAGATPANAVRAQTILNHARGVPTGNPPPPSRPPPAAPQPPPTPYGKIFTAGLHALGKAQVAKTAAELTLKNNMDAFRKAVPQTFAREAITLFNQAKGNAATLQQWESVPKLAGIAKRAQILTPLEKQWAGQVASHTVLDPNDHMHLWKKPWTPQAQDELAKQQDLGGFKTFADAMQAHYRPKTLDAAEVYTKNMTREIKGDERDTFQANLKNATAPDGSPLLMPATKKDYRYADSQYLPGQVVHRSVANQVNAVFGSSKLRNIWESHSSSMPEELAKRSSQFVADTLNNGIRSGGFLYSLFHPVQLGTQAVGHLTNPLSFQSLDMKNPTHVDAVEHGLTLGHSSAKAGADFLTGLSSSGGALGDFFRKVGAGALGDLTSKYSLSKAMTNFTAHVVDSLKLAAYPNVLARNMKVHANDIAAGRRTVGDVKYITTQQLNNSFGHLNYEMIGRGMTARHLASIALVSPDFLEARLRHAAQAVQAVAGATGSPFSPEARLLYKGGQEQLLSLLVVGAGMFAVARIINGLLNKGDTKWKTNPFSVVSGNREYSMRNTAEDAVKMAEDPERFGKARLSPLATFIWEGLSHADWRGNESTWGEAAQRAIGKAVPMPLQGIPAVKKFTDPNAKLSTGEQLSSATGIHVKAVSDVTPAYDVVDKFHKSIGKLPEHYPVSAFSQLKDGLEGNNIPKIKEEIAKLSKTLTPGDLAKKVNESIFHPWVEGKEQAAWDKFLDDKKGSREILRTAEAARRGMWARFLPLAPAVPSVRKFNAPTSPAGAYGLPDYTHTPKAKDSPEPNYQSFLDRLKTQGLTRVPK